VGFRSCPKTKTTDSLGDKPMKCLYYLTSSIESTDRISHDLHDAGVSDWLVHVLSKNEAGLYKRHIHSANYIERLDILRDGLVGTATGFGISVLVVLYLLVAEPFGPNMPWPAYLAIVAVLSMFGAWVGGLTGIASENKKMNLFHDDLESGKYLIIIYARKTEEEKVKELMSRLHPESDLAGVDSNFYNPFKTVQRI